MASLDMLGSFTLSPLKIDEVVTRRAPGNFAIGYLENRVFYVRYFGRSDGDINAAIKEWVDRRPDCDRFKFSYAPNARAAYLKHCRLFHDFAKGSGLSDTDHPKRPADTDWECPECGSGEGPPA